MSTHTYNLFNIGMGSGVTWWKKEEDDAPWEGSGAFDNEENRHNPNFVCHDWTLFITL